MSLKQPRECNNCGLLIYWDKTVPGNPKNRPFDHDNPGNYHRCFGSDSRGHEPNPKIPTAPELISCKFRCGTKIIYDTEDGKYKEGSLGGQEHKCPNLPPGYENNKPHQQRSYPNTNVHEDLKHLITQQNKLTEHISPPPPTTNNKPPVRQLEDLVKEQNLILQGIAAQLQKMLDTLEVSARYQKASKDILQEYKDEVIDTIKKPPMTFEGGRIAVGNDDDDGGTEDIYDEIADTDDHSDEDIGGFKPSDTGNKGVRNDLV